MSLSIGRFSPMNYSISNAASFSDAYTNSIKANKDAGALGNVDAAQPVMYPNAKAVESGPSIESLEKAKSANKAFNEVAAGFAGTSIGYNSASASYGYEMLGSNIDLFV